MRGCVSVLLPLLTFSTGHSVLMAEVVPDRIRFAGGSLHLYAGEQVTRTIEFAASHAEDEAVFFWRTQVGAVAIQSASARALPVGNGLLAAIVTIQAPSAERRINMELIAECRMRTSEVVREQFSFRVYPRNEQRNWNAVRERRIGVFDPSKTLRVILKNLEVQQDFLPALGSLVDYDGTLAIIGPGALQAGSAKRALGDLLANPAYRVPTLVLDQGGPLSPHARPEAIRYSAIIAAGHPVFAGLEELDLCGWRKDGSIASACLSTPKSSGYRSLLIAEGTVTGEGGDNLMLEGLQGSGARVVFCQLPLVERWDTEPVCEEILLNLLAYLSGPAPPPLRSGIAIYSNPKSTLQAAFVRELLNLEESWEPSEDQPVYADPDPSTILLLNTHEWTDSSLEQQPGLMTDLGEWVENGGKVLVVGLDQANSQSMEPLIGSALRLGQPPTGEIAYPKQAEPLLWGTRAMDWLAIRDHTDGRLVIEGSEGHEWTVLVEPGCLALRRMKKGQILVLNANVGSAPQNILDRLIGQLLTNMGTRVPEPVVSSLPFENAHRSRG